MIGKQISHFYVVGVLGSGGMGDVFEAQDLLLPRSVAIKLLKPTLLERPSAIRRFQREAWLSGSLNHPNICTILEFGEADGLMFLVMELLVGESLKQRLRSGPMPLRELLPMARGAAQGLAAAHGASIVHRDLTPGNIFLTDQGVTKLLDFGLAKALRTDGDEAPAADTVTEAGAVLGTVHYLAPEQASDGRVDRRSDLFALGAVLYEAATGAKPFDGRTRGDVMRQIATQPVVPLRRLAPHCPAALESIVERLLEKAPERRYQRASDLSRDLEALWLLVDHVEGTHPPTSTTGNLGLAVLPFTILGDEDATLRSFRDGLREDLVWGMQRVAGVRVAPQRSISQLRGQSAHVRAESLGVSAIIEGTVQHIDHRLRVIVRLLHADTEGPLRPPMRLDLSADDVLSAQDEVTQHVAAAIRTVIARNQAAATSSVPNAQLAYQHGLHSARDLFRGCWHEVIAHATRARELDPKFAGPEILLADAYNFLGMLSIMRPKIAFAKAEHAALRALALSDDLASAHAALALVRFGGDWDWDGAESCFRRALDLDPEHSTARVHYSWLLAMLGREVAAFAEADLAVASSPSRFVRSAAALTYLMCHRYDEALALAETCLARDPDHVFAILARGQCHHVMGNLDAARADLERAAQLGGRIPHYLGLLGKCYGDAGLRDEALGIVRELDALSSHTYVAPHCYLYVLHGLGQRERALQYQELAYQDGAAPINYFTPIIRSLFSLDPQHRDRLRQMRLNL